MLVWSHPGSASPLDHLVAHVRKEQWNLSNRHPIEILHLVGQPLPESMDESCG